MSIERTEILKQTPHSGLIFHNRYLVLDQNGDPKTEWWNSDRGKAAYIDFTKPEAANWYSSRLITLLADTGIDSYKFDAGESSWSPSVGI